MRDFDSFNLPIRILLNEADVRASDAGISICQPVAHRGSRLSVGLKNPQPLMWDTEL